MKIAIMADTHNNWVNFEKAIKWVMQEKIKLILHCGDIASQEIINDADKLFVGEIKYVKGNADWGLDLPEKLEVEVQRNPSASSGQVKIAFVHFPEMAKKLAKSGNFDLVFYGHTHRPWDEKIIDCHMINPGELAGQFNKPTFAVYDTASNKLELKLLEKL